MDGSTEDKQYEVIAFLLQKLGKYTEDKGRAFSYFSIVAKNYCIQTNNKAYKMLKSKTNLLAVDKRRNIVNEIVDDERRDSLKDFMKIFIDSYEDEIENRYSKQNEQKIAYAVLELFRRRENIEKNATTPTDAINKALMEFEYGSNGSTESQELLQLPSDGNKPSS